MVISQDFFRDNVGFSGFFGGREPWLTNVIDKDPCIQSTSLPS